MRSRNGNRPLLLACLALSTSLSHGADYYIGYRLASKNGIPVFENLSVSSAMRPCSEERLTDSLTLPRAIHEDLKQVLVTQQERFIPYAMRHEAHIQSEGNFHLNGTQISETMTLLTGCYAVEFNDEFVTITRSK